MFGQHNELTVGQFLARREPTLLFDLRGGASDDPAIPGAREIYILDLMDNIRPFQERHDAELQSRPVLLFCRHGGGSAEARKQFRRRYRVQSLVGGMVAYLETITRLLALHPYADPARRDETMRRMLLALTDRQTSFNNFRKIVDHLLACSTDPEVRRWTAP